MRALLIANPRASSAPKVRRDVITAALASSADLEVVSTRYRGHAAELARKAAEEGYDTVFTLGGDGTINEAVNGLLRSGGAAPALAAIPCGLSNVFVRALGMPADPIGAADAILKCLKEGRERRVGLGMAGDRYFTFSSGLGLDAEVIRAIDGQRAGGRPATQAMYVRSAIHHFYAVTDRRQPTLTLERDGHAPIGPLFIGIVSNTTPWTYLGDYPLNPNPLARFDAGLDVFALRNLRTIGTLNALRQMLGRRSTPPSGRHMVSLHDQAAITVRSNRPIAWHVDGEYLGETECVLFRSVPGALRVVA